MTKASDNAFPSILIAEGTEPSAPAAGHQRLYIDSTTHLLKATNSSGTDRTVEGVVAGAITTSGLTQATGKLLGRSTASTGAIEEITVGTNLTLSAGTLDAGGGTDADPWYIYIDPVITAHANTNWNTLANDGTFFQASVRQSSGAQDASVQWDLGFGSAGTWTIAFVHRKHTVNGIYHVQIDGSDVGTVDGYNAGGASPNNLSTITGVSIGAGKHTLKFLMSTKNASASNYYGQLQSIALLRTA